MVFESKVSEIFESPEIKAIEIEILNLYYEINRRWEANERNKFAITRLLKIRKKLLDKAFEWVFQDDMLTVFHYLDRLLDSLCARQ